MYFPHVLMSTFALLVRLIKPIYWPVYFLIDILGLCLLIIAWNFGCGFFLYFCPCWTASLLCLLILEPCMLNLKDWFLIAFFGSFVDFFVCVCYALFLLCLIFYLRLQIWITVASTPYLSPLLSLPCTGELSWIKMYFRHWVVCICSWVLFILLVSEPWQ